MSALPRIFLPAHNQITFRQLRGVPPNRICFATSHANAVKPNPGPYEAKTPFRINLPFRQGVAQEFRAATGVVLREAQSQYGGLWAPLTEQEAVRAKDWIASQGTRVFLKDFFDLSVALGERSAGTPLKETELGALFASAKYQQDSVAIREILARLQQTARELHSLPSDVYITSPPPRQGKDFDLPSLLAQSMARSLRQRFEVLGTWQGEKGQLKGVAVDEKWNELEKIGFEVNPKIVKGGKPVLMIDDIYQSGTTVNFLRSKLTASGVARASSLTIVKAARDTDNQ